MKLNSRYLATLLYWCACALMQQAEPLHAAVQCYKMNDPCEPVLEPPPPPPSSITYPATSSDGKFTVSWLSVPGATLYRLDELIGSTWTQIYSGPLTSQPLARGNGTYTYRVRACGDGTDYFGCSTHRVGSTITVLIPPPVPAGQKPPVLGTAQINQAFTWVLIHGDVPFLVPSFASAKDGAATISWSPVAGALRYEVRLQINGQWSSWVSVGSDTFYNFYSEDATSVVFEVRSCDAGGCGSGSSQTVTLSSWRDVGTCNPNTGEQQQVCIAGSCQHQLRYVARCSATTTCNIL
ncbi:MAG: hypothetical protein ACK4E7_04380 [Permianibacter sp.]